MRTYPVYHHYVDARKIVFILQAAYRSIAKGEKYRGTWSAMVLCDHEIIEAKTMKALKVAVQARLKVLGLAPKDFALTGKITVME